jgi:nicotinate-nucleotide pyrophosphorylase (carboxylating)
VQDGCDAGPGERLAEIHGAARPLLSAERSALNLLGRLSGIATATRDIAAAIRDYTAKVVCTRKTTPGLRTLEKYAVRAGGGANHRFGLDDAVLIKDNHRLIAGSVTTAIERVRRHVGHMVKIEVEVDTLDELEEVLGLGVDAILLDNMSLADIRRSVELARKRVVIEASGGITPETAREVAAAGVDLLSVGWLTHSAPQLDVALDIEPEL